MYDTNYVEIKWTSLNGINGRLIQSKINGNSIFLPASGYCDTHKPKNYGTEGYYWSRTLNLKNDKEACLLKISSKTCIYMTGYRYIGLSIRPVKEKAYNDYNLLSGNFSVSTTKKVKFTKGNLYWNGGEYQFEKNQAGFANEWSIYHVSHLTWASTKNATYYENQPYQKKFGWRNTLETTDKYIFGIENPITVEGTENLYVLTEEEWNYLINKRENAKSLIKIGVTVDRAINCIIIAPDDYDFKSGPLKSEYSNEELTKLNLVCLPAASHRGGSDVCNDNEGEYWSSTTASENTSACIIYFNNQEINCTTTSRRLGLSVRLVKDI